jgi:hypothetical protein
MTEVQRTPGVRYAIAEDGLELPVIDITHPAFAVTISDEELNARIAEHERGLARFERLPRLAQRLILKATFRRTRLARSMTGASSSVLPGMDTYLLKLGPQNLGPWASRSDRRFAAAAPLLGLRLRLQDMAQLLAEGLRPQLAAEPRMPLFMLNIAGGPAMDSLNALILLRKTEPSLLDGRRVRILVLDRADDGPAFGARALSALTEARGALQGVHVEWEHVRYDWQHAETLEAIAAREGLREAVCGASSEGGLFEYGDDRTIAANLEAIAASTSLATVLAGSVFRGDRPPLHGSLVKFAVKPRTLPAFTDVATRAGWAVDELRLRPATFNVRLRRSA